MSSGAARATSTVRPRERSGPVSVMVPSEVSCEESSERLAER